VSVSTPALIHSIREPQLQQLQEKAFRYFQRQTNPANGLVRDKDADNWPASIAATGLALAAYPVAVERGFLGRREAIERTLATLKFFDESPQGTEPDATGYRGFYYHFLDMQSGRRVWDCEISTVDSAFLLAGMLAAAQYFDGDTADERRIRELARSLYERVDWSWAVAPNGTIRHGWKPETGFIPFEWQGYDEGLLLYVLALGSSTNPLPPSTFAAWASTYEWKSAYDIDHLYSAPLFTHQLSHIWIDFRGIQDDFMRAKGIDYFENTRRATLAQQRYAIDNPQGFKGYGAECWGITASDGPGPATLKIDGVVREFFDYEGRGAPYGIDDGTVAPWAVVASLPFAPEIVLPTLHHFVHRLQLHEQHPFGFKASFNLTYADNARIDGADGWISPFCFGLNLGPIVLMVENHRSGMLWNLMRNCPPIVRGLCRAGFDGGWLNAARNEGSQ
jgi:hypothetical protein